MPPLSSHIPIWQAISEFYLDAELQQSDYQRIAKILKDSGLLLEELKDIDLYEVFPSFQANLNQVAGEWASFTDEVLIEECSKNYHKRNHSAFRMGIQLKNKVFYSMRKHHWDEIAILMEII